MNSENIRVECAENCGNSPKKQMLKELSIAFVKKEIDFCLNCMSDDVIWNIIGDRLNQGKGDYEKALWKMGNREVQELHIHNIITHGNVGSVNSTLILDDERRIERCDVYNFGGFGKNSKIKKITSYVIEIV
ncbi:nuclear transport factor 2-like protein [Bacillus tuaregi]|uniref:hypothetical protein n=1 Tax=Bacillus tuaregi TaxID=1816695 RepID=UPI0008F917F5|nr:hypothetical protein [Bacillus tuaregi]